MADEAVVRVKVEGGGISVGAPRSAGMPRPQPEPARFDPYAEAARRGYRSDREPARRVYEDINRESEEPRRQIGESRRSIEEVGHLASRFGGTLGQLLSAVLIATYAFRKVPGEIKPPPSAPTPSLPPPPTMPLPGYRKGTEVPRTAAERYQQRAAKAAAGGAYGYRDPKYYQPSPEPFQLAGSMRSAAQEKALTAPHVTYGGGSPHANSIAEASEVNAPSAVGLGTAAVVGAAALVAVKAELDAAKAIGESVGSFVSAMARSSADVPRVFEFVGGGLEMFAVGLGLAYAPLLPFAAGLALGAGAVKSFGEAMRGVSEAAQRYGEYSPQIATELAIAEVRQTLGDLRRAQDLGPTLAAYISEQSKLSQSWEDFKARMLSQVVPVMTAILAGINRIIGDADDARGIHDPLAEILENRGILVP